LVFPIQWMVAKKIQNQVFTSISASIEQHREIDRYLSWWLLVGRVENWAASTNLVNWSRLDCCSTALMIERCCCYPIKLLSGCTHVNYLDKRKTN
jgi:hypothetical protein